MPSTSRRRDADRRRLLGELATGVGGSESHHLWSLEPYGCRRQLWYAKTGVPADFPFAGNRDTERGANLEPVAVRLYTQRTARQVLRVGLYRHPREIRLIAHPDRLIPARRGTRQGVLEVKCPGLQNFARVKKHGLPPHWVTQLQHTMCAVDATWGSIAVLNAERWELLHFDLPAEPGWEVRLLAEVRAFWQQVESGEPPERLPATDARCRGCGWRTACQGQALLEMRGRDEEAGGAAQRDEALAPLVADYLAAQEVADEAAQSLEEARDRLTAAVGDRQRVTCEAGRVSYAVQERVTLDTARLRASYPDLAKDYERRGVSRVLRVTPA